MLALFITTLGLVPHLMFAFQTGALAFFKSAYDEDTYALWILDGGGPSVPSRLLSRAATRAVFALSGDSWDLAYVAADVIFPVLATVVAWVLAGLLTRAPVVRLLLTIGVLFAQEFFSLCCSAIWGYGVWHLRYLVSAVVPWARELMPDSSTSYFSLFRTPEPQVSLVVFLGFLALLVRLTTPERGQANRRLVIALMLANAALAVVYVFLAVPLVVLQIVYGGVLALTGKRWETRRTLLLGLIGLASVALSSFAAHAGPGLRDSASFLFPSRLPVITPASVVSALLLGVLGSSFRRETADTARLALAAACFGTVVILTNQQVVTGWMISARGWEQYANYSLLLLGTALWVSARTARTVEASGRRAGAAAAALLALAAGLLAAGQLRVFQAFRDSNQKTLAMKRALQKIDDLDPRRTKLVLEEPELAPLLEFRMNGRLPCVLDYTDVTRRIARLAESDGNWGLQSPFKKRLFEHFARTGLGPDAVRRLLLEEADRRSGFFSAFLFSLMDQWYPLTDDRKVRQPEIRAMLPEIVRDYAGYLESGSASWDEPAVLLTTNDPMQRSSPAPWEERLLAQATVGGGRRAVTASALLQTVRKDPR